jgi:hypothetical protein
MDGAPAGAMTMDGGSVVDGGVGGMGMGMGLSLAPKMDAPGAVASTSTTAAAAAGAAAVAGVESQIDGSCSPQLQQLQELQQQGGSGGIWDGVLLGSGAAAATVAGAGAEAAARGLASLSEAPRVSAAELVPDTVGSASDPNALARSIGEAELEALRQALEEQRAALGGSGGGGGGCSQLEEYTHENPAYPNPLEFALCRRESPGVMRALCAAFPTAASELLPGGQQQLPLHAACVSGGNWLVPPSFAFTFGNEDGEGGEEEEEEQDLGVKVDDSAAAVVSSLLQAHPAAASCPDADGCYPLHCKPSGCLRPNCTRCAAPALLAGVTPLSGRSYPCC